MRDAAAADVTIEVSKADSTLRATRADGTLVFFAPVSSGSEHDPLPPGDWKVTGVGWHPVFHYNPDLFWDAKPKDEKATIKAGTEQPGRRRLDRAEPRALRSPRHAGAGQHRPHRVARLRAADQLGRGARRGAGQAGDGGHLQMSKTRMRGAVPLAISSRLCRRRGDRRLAADLRSTQAGDRRADLDLRTAPTTSARPRENRDPTPPDTFIAAPPAKTPAPVATTGDIPHGRLRMPIDGEDIESLKGGFAETRGGNRPHEAVDMLAPRNTPVHAVESGTIAKLFTSKAGGLTIYQFDPSGRLCYYYAHLERYADGLNDGQAVSAGRRHRLRRHDRQRAAQHAAPAFRGVRAERRQALVAGPADRSVSGCSKQG